MGRGSGRFKAKLKRAWRRRCGCKKRSAEYYVKHVVARRVEPPGQVQAKKREARREAVAQKLLVKKYTAQ